MDTASIVSIAVIYPILFIGLARGAIKYELMDMNCPDGPNTVDKTSCKDGNGKLWANYRTSPGDSVSKSLDKISELNKNYGKNIIWRKCVVMGIFASMLIFLITQRRPPNGFELLGSSVVIFIICYMTTSYYRQHHDRFIEDALDDNIKYIRSKLNTTVSA